MVAVGDAWIDLEQVLAGDTTADGTSPDDAECAERFTQWAEKKERAYSEGPAAELGIPLDQMSSAVHSTLFQAPLFIVETSSCKPM